MADIFNENKNEEIKFTWVELYYLEGLLQREFKKERSGTSGQNMIQQLIWKIESIGTRDDRKGENKNG